MLTLIAALPASALEKVTLQLKWTHQFQFAGYYAAVEKGYYREAGLDVEIREALPEQDTAREVTKGNADFGVGTSNLVLLRAQGEPVVVLGVIYQHSPFVLISTQASGIQDIHELSRRKIMMELDAAELLAYFKHEGIDVSKVDVRPHTFRLEDLLEDKVQGMACYSTDQPFFLKEKGIPYQVFNPRAGGIDFYGDNLFTTEKQIRENPERVKRFLDASLRGWKYAMAHQEEMVDLILKKYPQDHSRDHLLFEAAESVKLIHPELIELGYVNPGRWESIVKAYADLGFLKDKVDLKSFIYERDPKPDLRWVYWSLGAIAVVAAAFGLWTLMTARMNRLLREEVAARKDAEARALAENAAKSRFLSVLAHEVRTPLSGILSSLWLYKTSETQEEKDQVVEIAEMSSNHLLRLVDNTLDHSKLEAAKMDVEKMPVIIDEFLDRIVELFHAAANAKAISLEMEIDPAMPDTITTDPTRLRQILSNLISNAVKFTSKGGVKVVATQETPYSTVEFKVQDTGPGISPDQTEKIFEPYAQADPSVSREHGGTGLGLSISSQLARLLGGEVRVESKPGEGATFTLSIPDMNKK
ncbi:ABC transporter substrate-binding protein [Luteolibacter sp. SL250]|uniref:ABC transporter substrate-binding protein n=1 Tax=Luteolibacter sp. SL250 TaxID=2995170 RepID=UPI00226EE0B1|nr:ABC transporter substrate-binding protein [Luteolibacter sp. SL250]WAC18680.1 ABC transporter substrate-binding protein [Luteolibacter sp. SL250]